MFASFSRLNHQAQTRIAQWGCCLAALLLPLKLSITYIALVPLILWAIIFRGKELLAVAKNSALSSSYFTFIFACLLSIFAGLNIGHGLPSLFSSVFSSLIFLLVLYIGEPRRIIAALLVGQSIAALHTLIDAVIPGVFPEMFLGKVTESGQLAITLPVAAAWLFTASRDHEDDKDLSLIKVIFTILVFVFTGISTTLGLPLGIRLSFLFIALAWSLYEVLKVRTFSRLVKYGTIPLLVTALLVNLKRGPWFGVLLAFCLMLAMKNKRYLPWLMTCAAAILILAPPMRERLMQSYDHFTISGGRKVIWQIGYEMAVTYPLGIGYHNSELLRKFAPEIPEQLKHFHNNLLNVLVETGWIGLICYLWWIIAALRLTLRSGTDNIFIFCIGCALLSWQLAGIFEYNVGDSEVIIPVFILLGVAERLRNHCTRITTDPQLNPAPTTAVTTY